ncbi:MAG TPA: nucleotidyltransferase domain-containing protein [Thermoanaerobaculia bacterium]|nr:nucleotidyltransferase domain-containing protein [Thermoanaerobaculia bacterium]
MTSPASIAAISRDFPEIAAIYLFGSIAGKEEHAGSDADVGIVLRDRRAPGPGWRWRADLAGRLEELFPGRSIDLVILDEQGPLFRHQVLLHGRLLHEADRDRRIDFESSTFVEAFDFHPTWRLATGGRIGSIRKALQGKSK